MKIWLKFMGEDKMLKNKIFDTGLDFDPQQLTSYIYQACQELDEPTPIIVSKHINHFTNFNTTNFSQDDFVEDIHFKKLIIEAIPDKEKKEKKWYY